MTGSYVYTNTSDLAQAHHQYLSAMLDEHTTARLSTLRVPLRDARVLEVGAGGGSVACWLADAVAPGGHVVATDLTPLPMPQHPRLAVHTHDIATQQVPAPPWDVIHARLLLLHLPERVQVLGRLAAALRPGGALLVEDMDMTWTAGRAMAAPSDADRRLYESYHDALTAVFVKSGVEPGWACRVPQVMAHAGLVDITTRVHTRGWAGGSAGALFTAGGSHQIADQLIAEGLAPQDLERVRELMHDPRMIIRVSPMVSTVGYRPTTDAQHPTGWQELP